MIETTSPSYFIGQRVITLDDKLGTICYAGPIDGITGLWLGIDWDDSQRGRHNGTFKGVCYFKAEHEKSGSFVRPEKIQVGENLLTCLDYRYCRGFEQITQLEKKGLVIPSNVINAAKNFELQKQKEDPIIENENDCTNETNDQFVRQACTGMQTVQPQFHRSFVGENSGVFYEKDGWRDLTIELVGLSEICLQASDLQRMRQIHLNSTPVRICGEEDARKFSQLCPRVVELNLAQTLLSEWLSVANICHHLTDLNHLNVSDNRIRIPFVIDSEKWNRNTVKKDTCSLVRYYQQVECVEMQEIENAFHGLHKVVMVRMNYTWEDFLSILPWFDNVECLVIAYNRIQSFHIIDNINLVQSAFSNLNYLDLTGNKAIGMAGIAASRLTLQELGRIPKLQQLMMHDCSLAEIFFPGSILNSEIPGGLFGNLSVLGLSDNEINNWSSIHQLNRLPHLKELIFIRNPLQESNQLNLDTFRQWVIAKVIRLQILNKMDISKGERRGAEFDYLRVHGKAYVESLLSTTTSKDTTSELIPHEDFLLAHPQYMKLVEKHGAPESSELEQFTKALREEVIRVILTCELSEKPNVKSVERKLPRRTTVQHLIPMARRIFNLRSNCRIKFVRKPLNRPDILVNLDVHTREIGFYDVENGDTLSVESC